MILFPPAKINLGLRVLNRRRDGFHNVETILLAVGLHDALEMVVADGPSGESPAFYRSGLSYPALPAGDLVMQAFHAAAHHIKSMGGSLPPVKVQLHKCIPAGSGLGGGSSDAAAMLWLLRKMVPGHMSAEMCMMLAATIGSDCSFFMRRLLDEAANTSDLPGAMLATGRGDKLQPIPIPELRGKFLLLVCPDIHISTAEAYRHIVPSGGATLAAGAPMPPMQEWPSLLINDFERRAIETHPTIGTIKKKLYAMGAFYASMSGTGSVVYGIFSARPDAASLLAFPGCFIRTCPIP